jgi:hypothetical protein
MMNRRFATVVVVLALAPGCGGEVGVSTDGNTSWLRCPKQGCGEGYTCVNDRCVASKVMPIAARDAGSAAATASAPPSTQPSPTASVSRSKPPPTPQIVRDAGLASCTQLSDPLGGRGSAVSFRNDILPMFGLSCVTSDCHSPQDYRAELNLGFKCAYDATAKWKCTFPAQSNPDPTMPQQDDAHAIDAIYMGLMQPSTTVQSQTVYRVKPGDPENSFLVLKLADQQNSRGYSCVNQDPSHESNPPPCGVSMPQGGDPFCTGSAQTRFNAIVAWIAQGAPNN